ncbi:MAG TPA: hypothetical protein VK907_02190 [Phnomibacter sp.]|nr:hypothetical protein [Phnomibacter sp.]
MLFSLLPGLYFFYFNSEVPLPGKRLKTSDTYRRVATLAILLSLLAPLWYSVDFYVSRMQHRLMMWRETEKGMAHDLVLDSATIQWTKKNRELIIDGEYFDITSIRYNNGKAFVTGVFDHEETKMHEAFEAAQQKQESPAGHATQRIADWLMTGWMGEHTDDLSFLCEAGPGIKHATEAAMHPKTADPPPLPPPRHHTYLIDMRTAS